MAVLLDNPNAPIRDNASSSLDAKERISRNPEAPDRGEPINREAAEQKDFGDREAPDAGSPRPRVRSVRFTHGRSKG
jgi:hypothetical protein